MGLEFNVPVLFLREPDERIAKEYPALAERAKELAKGLADKQLPMLDSLSQFYGGTTHEMRRENYLKSLRDLKPGVSELIIHCGFDSEELRGITNSSSNRDGDRRIFTDPEIIAEIKKLGIELISWKQLREMNQKPKEPRTE